MADISLPPWMRRIQQTWYWQKFLQPMGVGFATAVVLQGCLGHGIEHIEMPCMVGAGNSMITALITKWTAGHSQGSTAFASDGTPIAAAPKLKALADAAIAMQTNATDPKSPVTQAQATDAAATVARVDTVVATVLANTQNKKGV